MGIQTGIDLDKLVEIGEWISKTLNRQNESRAGAALYAKRTDTKQVSYETTTSVPMSSDTLLISRADSTGTITLNNSKKGNILSASMIQHLRSIITSFSSDPSIQSIVLTNIGKYFCTVMDLS